MLSQRLHTIKHLQRHRKSAFGTLQRIHGPLLLSHEQRMLFKATAFIFGISSVNLYALFCIFRKYITHQRVQAELKAIQQANNHYLYLQNHLYDPSQNKHSIESQILFPAFLRSKISENSYQQNEHQNHPKSNDEQQSNPLTQSQPVLNVSAPSQLKLISDHMAMDESKINTNSNILHPPKIHNHYHYHHPFTLNQNRSNIHTQSLLHRNKRHYSQTTYPHRTDDTKLSVDGGKFRNTNALFMNPEHKEALKRRGAGDKNLKYKLAKYMQNNDINNYDHNTKNGSHQQQQNDNRQLWEERKAMNYNQDVVQNEYRDMRFRQINQCFEEINGVHHENEYKIDNDVNGLDEHITNYHTDALNYFDYDYSYKQNIDPNKPKENEEYIRKSKQLQDYNYMHNYSYLNNNYDDDHLNLFQIHHFVERVMHKDQHGMLDL